MKITVFLLTILMAAVLSACGGGDDDLPTTKVYKYRGAVECVTRGTPPEIMQNELLNVGIPVKSFACALDGTGRNGACLAGSDELNVFEIPVRDVAKANMLTYRLFEELLNEPAVAAREIPCPPVRPVN